MKFWQRGSVGAAGVGRGQRRGSWQSLGAFAKRSLDVALAVVMVAATLPILLVAIAVILLDDGAPVFFGQPRIGRGGRPFTLLKLRSMRVHQQSVEEVGHVGADHLLLTRAGRIIRRLKIDELPQLWNVLRGEMTLVGPRPTILEQYLRYDWYERRRCEMRPGLSGWAQVNGNVSLRWPERILLDVWYIDHRSVWLDAKILALTVLVVVRGERPNPLALEEATRYARGAGWGS
jgi:lipopolysaccharide/colanic/teichoic acid biosynthesis glycosyltransferase